MLNALRGLGITQLCSGLVLKDGEGCLAGNWDGSTLVLALQDNLGKLTKLVTAWISCRERRMALFFNWAKKRAWKGCLQKWLEVTNEIYHNCYY